MVEAYKLSKECRKEKVAFSELAFTEGMDDTRKRAANRYLDLNLRFLDKVEDQAKDAPATRVEGATSPPIA